MSVAVNVLLRNTKSHICAAASRFYYKEQRYYSKKSNALPADSPLKELINDSASYMDKILADSEDKWATMPYSHLPSEHSLEKPKADPRDASVILFPGQGAQFVGMGTDLMRFPMAARIYEMANEVLKMDLRKICFEGPRGELDKNCQLAILVTSLATLERLKEERPSAIEKCAAVAGFSLGEITALVFTGALDFEEALRLVQIRQTAMDAASNDFPGGMLRIMCGPEANIGNALFAAKEYCQNENIPMPICSVANYLFPACKVIAGTELALQFLENQGKKFGIRHTERIKVSGAFHSELMRPALEPFKAALKMCNIRKPIVTVFSNVDAKPYRNEAHILKQLPRQIVNSVKWEQTMHNLFARTPGAGFPQIFTIGPGESLRSILRKVNAPAWDGCIPIAS